MSGAMILFFYAIILLVIISSLRKKRNRAGSGQNASGNGRSIPSSPGGSRSMSQNGAAKGQNRGRYNVLLSDDVDVQRYTDAGKKSPFDRTPRFGFGADSLEEMNRDYNKKHGTYKDPFEVR